MAPKVYADFNNADALGRIRLNSVGTTQDLAREQIRLSDGLMLLLYCDDANDDGQSVELQANGAVEFSTNENCWVAKVNWDALQRVPAASSRDPRRNGSTSV
jgi:hypothetical protein